VTFEIKLKLMNQVMCNFKNEGSHSDDLLNKIIKVDQSGDVLLQE